MADSDISKMKVADLKRELKIRGLHTTGNKNDLVERLQSAIIEGDVFDETGISEDLLDDNDDVLNDDELDEETKSFLNSTSQDEDVMLKSPQGSSTSKSPEGDASNSTASSVPAQQKKVVLKRKLTSSISLTDSEAAKSTDESANKVAKVSAISADPTTASSSDADDSNEKRVIKLTEMSMKERLELRAKKFGASASSDALKQARAERFGVSATTSTSATDNNSKAAPSVSVDILKKRAERFGGSVSKVMSNIENKEKMLKRQERFGSGPEAVKKVDEKTATDFAEKAKLRLERFKTAVK